MFNRIRKRMKGQKGFTLIELLVVIIIIAILAAIAIPTFLGQREKAQDAASKSLVRNAMTAMESTYVDLRDFSIVTQADLQAVEPAIAWAASENASAATSPTALTKDNAVDWSGTGETTYVIGTVSESDNTFGVAVDKSTGPGAVYYINGDEVQAGWIGGSSGGSEDTTTTTAG
jgi:type IV pilus assembly protein PilA